MSVRFQARLLADRYSAWIDADARGASVAQVPHSQTRTLLGNALDVGMGSLAIATYNHDAARTAIGLAYLARAAFSGVAASFTGFRISFGSGTSSGDPEVHDFNRKHRIASAITNAMIGTALLTTIGGIEAAMLIATKGTADIALSQLVENLTQATEDSIDELVRIVTNPPSERHRRVALSDLMQLGAAGLAGIGQALANAKDEAAVHLLTAMEVLIRHGIPEDQTVAGATAVTETALNLLQGDALAVRHGCALLQRLPEAMRKAMPATLLDRLAAAEAAFVERAMAPSATVDDRLSRREVGYGVASASGRTFTPVESLLESWFIDSDGSVDPKYTSGIRAFGKEAVEPLRDKIARLTERQKAAENAAYVVSQLKAVPVEHAFENPPHTITDETPTGHGLLLMRATGNIEPSRLSRWAGELSLLTQQRRVFEDLLAELDPSAASASPSTREAPAPTV